MKSQYGWKQIPGDLWAWIERQALSRQIEINDFIFRVLDYARCNWQGRNPLDAKPVVLEIRPAGSDASEFPDKDQYCLRSIPEHIWKWVAEERKASGKPYKTIITNTLDTFRRGLPQKTLFDGQPLVPRPSPALMPFKFIDLFAGIGGFRVALQGKLGGKCVFSSEWDKFCLQTYERWFGDRPNNDDIREIDLNQIPPHDILVGGFPCQPFSLAGVSKKQSLGHKHGFECERQGNLFFRICDIATKRKPEAMILENVKNLRSHDKGKTWKVIESSLEDIGYCVHPKVIDAADYVPQHRERLIIVCFRRDLYGKAEEFRFPDPPEGRKPKFRDILDESPDQKYILTDHLWNYLQEYARKHQAKGNGFGFGMTDLDGVSRTLSARYHKDGSEVLIPRQPTDPKVADKGDRNPRRLSPVEASRLMGFSFVRDREDIPVSDTQAYRQFGNAVVPDVVEAVAINVLKVMAERERKKKRKQAMNKTARQARQLLKKKALEAVS